MSLQGPEKTAAVSTDSTREVRSAPSSGRSLVEFPTTNEQHKEWSQVFQKQKNSFPGQAENDLPGLELFSKGHANQNERAYSSSDKSSGILQDGDGLDGKSANFPSSVQRRIDELQKQERERLLDHHERETETLHEVCPDDEANKHAYEWQFQANRSSDKTQKLKEITGRLSHTQISETSLAENSDLMVQALNGTITSNFQPSGFDLPPLEVSVNQLKIEERDGQVMLTDPNGLVLVKPDGKLLRAAELPKYLRSDGTLLLGPYGQALGPGEKGNDRKNYEPPPLKPPETLVAGTDLPLTEHKIKDSLEQITTNTSQSNLEPPMPGIESPMPEIKDADDTSNAQSLARGDKAPDKTHKTRLGETLRSVALTNKNLNDVSLWPLLAEKNNLSTDTDAKGVPVEVLQRGTLLTLPTAAEIASFKAQQKVEFSLISRSNACKEIQSQLIL